MSHCPTPPTEEITIEERVCADLRRRGCRVDESGLILTRYGLHPTCMSGAGYKYITVRLDGRRVALPCHRVVWCWFRGAIPRGMCIDHIDGQHRHDLDNRISNLRVVSRAENTRLAHQAGVYARAPKYADLDEAAVGRIKAALAGGMKAPGLAKAFGVSRPTIYAIKAGRRWAHVKPDPGILEALRGEA